MTAKEKILNTASRLFAKQGYNSTGINQIIEESDVAKGSFYYNFKSKEALCIAFLNRRHVFWSESLKAYTESRNEGAPSLLALFDFLELMNVKENYQGCSFLNILSEISDTSPKILAVIQDHKEDLRTYISSMSETINSDHIYLLFEGALIESQVFKSQWPVERAKSIVKTLIN